MITKNDIENYIDDSILDSIFREREEELYYTTKSKEDTKIKEIKKQYTTDYQKLMLTIKNLPSHFHNIREDIIKALEDYRIREDLLVAYDNEKFYKIGVCDGIGLILESLKNNNNK